MATPRGLDIYRARKLRRYLEDRWMEKTGESSHGWQVGLAGATKVKRATLGSWVSEKRPKVPKLDTLEVIADYFNVSRVEIVAAMDGLPLMTEAQAREWMETEIARQSQLARQEGFGPTPPKRPTVLPGGTAPRRTSGR